MMSEKILTIKNLHVEYHTDEAVVHAVNGIDLELSEGETLGLVGETGAGKTTTALSILRLLPDRIGKVTDGSIIFDSVDVLNAPKTAMRQLRGGEISMIFQDPMTSLNPVLTVEKQIGEAIFLHDKKIGKSELAKRVDEILQMVGISPARKHDYPHQFSGGMKQRVVIAMALACRPRLLIADEPTTALDVTIQAQVLDMMSHLRNTLNTSMILITHDLGIVVRMCDYVAIMYAGEIVEYGSVYDIYDPGLPHHPYTIGLFDSIPNLNKQEKRLRPIEGMPPDPSKLPMGCKFAERCKRCSEICGKAPVTMWQKDTHRILCSRVGAHEEVQE